MKGNPELETTRHTKGCINFIRRPEICRVWDVSFSLYPSQRLRVFFANFMRLYFAKRATTMPPQSLFFCNRNNLRFNSPPGVFRNTANLNLKKISAKSSRFCVCYLRVQMQTLCRAVEILITTSCSTSVKFFYRGLTEVFIASPFCDQGHEGQVKFVVNQS